MSAVDPKPPAAASTASSTTSSADALPEGGILLFDGVCNFCNGSVLFVLERDPQAYFHFASLQSNVGRALIRRFGLREDIDTIVLIEGGKAYERSNAAFRAMRHLGPGWRALATLGLLIPRVLRDFGYRLFARYRYAMFGKAERCMVPTPDVRRRFLPDSA